MTQPPEKPGTEQRPKPRDHKPLQIDFAALADAVRHNEQHKTIPAEVRELFTRMDADLRHEVADVEPHQIGRILLAASVLTTLIIEDDTSWTARSVANLLASVGERLFTATTADAANSADETPVRSWLAQNLGLGRRADNDEAEDGAGE